ncbi:MAG: hypothetical protein L0Y66_00780 [Myxococcaceae bacterium]|nr:hypothetical protein [Myxococcaceae bacterium]MCI0669650.1 hypothetical protein [Myxococcaceae bacterium]
MRGWLLAGLGLLGVVAACVGVTQQLDELRFACESSEQCVAPYVCVGGECVPEALADAGGTDGGEQQQVPEQCSDGQDNDGDGLVDCADADCIALTCAGHGRVCGGGKCVCVGNGRVPEVEEATCLDGADNDCDGLTDCEDPACAGLACGLGGKTCVGGTCTCSGNGGAPEDSELSCADQRDNDCDGRRDCKDMGCGGLTCSLTGYVCDATACVCPPDAGEVTPGEPRCDDNVDDDCDGLVDCADSSCSGQACGLDRHCIGSVCTCLPDGGVPEVFEQTCGDGQDGDCDGRADCEDPDCAGLDCGVHGLRCSASSCTCSGNGGASEPAEQSCGDGFDNDCDGLADCGDPDCERLLCAAPALTCNGGQCVCAPEGGAAETTERTCSDGVDNDCDGLADCRDADCSLQQCSAASTSILCCGSSCVDISANQSNCGGCGIACKPGKTCQAVTVNALRSGRCTCSTDSHCPQDGVAGLTVDQQCENGKCACETNAQCGTGQSCTRSEGLTDPGWCHY